MEFLILGPLQVLEGGQPIELAGSKRRAVLALLVLHANEVVRTERLIDELWGEQPPRNATAALHNHISRLRRELGPDVLARREWGYVLRTDDDGIDLLRFERLVAHADPLPAAGRSAKLAEALKLWRGPPLEDLAHEPALQLEIARLEELRLTTQERRIDADLEAGRNSELVGEIETLIAAHPLREHLRWQLILALYRAGRQAEALEVYRETRRVLSEELGLEPSPELKELEQAVLRQDPGIAATARAVSAASIEQPRHSTRRAALLGLLGFGLLGLGVAVPLMLIGHGRAHPSARSAPAAVSTVVSTAATTQSAQHPTTAPAHVHVAKRTLVPRHVHRHPLHHATVRSVHVTAPPSAVGVASSKPKSTSGTAATKSKGNRVRSAPVRATPRSTATKPRIITISDNFDGSQLDGTIWYPIHFGTGWNMSEHDGHLEFAFPPGTATGGPYDTYGGHVGTLCQFPGDFDARVDFALVQWPQANGLAAHLRMFYEPDNAGWAGVFRQSSAQWGEQYIGSLESGRFGGAVSLGDTSGAFRVRRHNGLVTTYYLHNGHWMSFGSRYDSRPVLLTVGVESPQHMPVRRDPVVVDFDNFTVTATNPTCPGGVQGSG